MSDRPIALPPRREGVSDASYARAMLAYCGNCHGALANALGVTEADVRKMVPAIRPPFRPRRRV